MHLSVTPLKSPSGEVRGQSMTELNKEQRGGVTHDLELTLPLLARFSSSQKKKEDQSQPARCCGYNVTLVQACNGKH